MTSSKKEKKMEKIKVSLQHHGTVKLTLMKSALISYNCRSVTKFATMKAIVSQHVL